METLGEWPNIFKDGFRDVKRMANAYDFYRRKKTAQGGKTAKYKLNPIQLHYWPGRGSR